MSTSTTKTEVSYFIDQIEQIITGSKFKPAMNQFIFSLPASSTGLVAKALGDLLSKYCEIDGFLDTNEIDHSQHRQLDRLAKVIDTFMKRIFEQEMMVAVFDFGNDNNQLTSDQMDIVGSFACLFCYISKDCENLLVMFLDCCQKHFDDLPDFFWTQTVKYLVVHRRFDTLDWLNYGASHPRYHQLLIAMIFEARKAGISIKPLDFERSMLGVTYSEEEFEQEAKLRFKPINISLDGFHARGLRVMVNDKYYQPVMEVFERYQRFIYKIKAAHRQIRDFAQDLSLAKIKRRWQSIRKQVYRGVREHRPHRIGIRWQPFVDLSMTNLEIWRDDSMVEYPSVRVRVKQDFLIHKKDYDLVLHQGILVGADDFYQGEPGDIDYDTALVANWLIVGVYGMIVTSHSSQDDNGPANNGDQAFTNHLNDCYEVRVADISPHLRALNGQQVGEDRVELCQKLLGIELPDGYTVVSPHQRSFRSNEEEDNKPDIYVNCLEDPNFIL